MKDLLKAQITQAPRMYAILKWIKKNRHLIFLPNDVYPIDDRITEVINCIDKKEK